MSDLSTYGLLAEPSHLLELDLGPDRQIEITLSPLASLGPLGREGSTPSFCVRSYTLTILTGSEEITPEDKRGLQ